MRMRARAIVAAAVLVGLAGCGGSGGSTTPQHRSAPVLGQRGDEKPQGPPLGFPVFATKNTTRVAGADPIADAAGVAQAVYPALTPDTRPQIVVLADANDWRTGIAAAQLGAAPLHAPILLAQGNTLPPATQAALSALQPTGDKQLGGAQVIRVGTRANVTGFKTVDLTAASPAALAATIDREQATLTGQPASAVVIASSDSAPFSMPAAGWAAKSGDPVLWTGKDALPPETRQAIARHPHAHLYVLGPPAAVSDAVLGQLRKLGPVKRIAGADPVANAIAFARFDDGGFGWKVVDPGHGLVFASTQRPQDAAAAAPLSASGSYGPLLLVTDASTLPAALQGYLLDIEPGFRTDPVRGVYNHGWVMGDETAIAGAVQARMDTLLEIEPVSKGGE